MRSLAQSRTPLVLLLLLLFGTAWNLDKAFHVDDTAHLEIAQWIAKEPLRPMSGTLHWAADEEPIHKTNQPHLYFYAMAGWGKLFGWSERSMHMLLAVFALVAIVTMYRLALDVGVRSPLLLTSFLALGPAFVVGQNTMVDVPLLAAWLVFYWSLLTKSTLTDATRYAIAAIACSVALLLKYVSLPLIPILAVHIYARRRIDLWYLGALPLAILLGWSLFNWLDYGGVHLLEREAASRSISDLLLRSLGWLLCLGAVTPFALHFYPHAISNVSVPWSNATRVLLIGFVLCMGAVAVLFWFGALSDDAIYRLLKLVFLLNGAALFALAIAALLPLFRKPMDPVVLSLGYWLLSGFAFIVLLAPFMAARHVLLVLPPLLLLAGRWVKPGRTSWAASSLAVTICLTTLLAASDRWYAEIYREQAKLMRAALPASAAVWFTGHWGWQWYAKQNGMRQVNIRGKEKPSPGDFVVTPQYGSPSSAEGLALTRERCVSIARSNFIHSFAVQKAGFYASHLWKLPWSLSREPIEKFCIYRVGTG